MICCVFDIFTSGSVEGLLPAFPIKCSQICTLFKLHFLIMCAYTGARCKSNPGSFFFLSYCFILASIMTTTTCSYALQSCIVGLEEQRARSLYKLYVVQTEFKRKTARLNFKTCNFHRGPVTSHDCFRSSDKSALWCHWVHQWARLHADWNGAQPQQLGAWTGLTAGMRPLRKGFKWKGWRGGVGGGCSVYFQTSPSQSPYWQRRHALHPRMTPMLKREHPVPEILIVPLASPNCGGPLCWHATERRSVPATHCPAKQT